MGSWPCRTGKRIYIAGYKTFTSATDIGPYVSKLILELARDPSAAIEKKLDEAALNAQLDIAYAHEMNVQITDTIALMQRLRKATNSTSTREYLVKTIADLQGIQKQLTKIINTSAS